MHPRNRQNTNLDKALSKYAIDLGSSCLCRLERSVRDGELLCHLEIRIIPWRKISSRIATYTRAIAHTGRHPKYGVALALPSVERYLVRRQFGVRGRVQRKLSVYMRHIEDIQACHVLHSPPAMPFMALNSPTPKLRIMSRSSRAVDEPRTS